MPCVVRPHGKKGNYQILAGHRRSAGAEECGMDVPCVVRDLEDGEALELLLNENLQREDLTPADEARLVEAMEKEMGLSAEEIAERVSRSMVWVRTRQLLLDLGNEELMGRVSAPRGAEEHVSIGSVEALLEVPEALREEAVQLVLHPALQVEALRPVQARDCLRELLIEPWRRAEQWNDAKKASVAFWKKTLKENGVDTSGVLLVAVDYKEREMARRGTMKALEMVPEVDLTEAAPRPLTWLALAIRHGLALKVVPTDDAVDSELLVDAHLLRAGEAAREEHGEQPWLAGRTSNIGHRTSKDEGRVNAALRDLEGEVEHDEMTEEKPEVVIEQTMKHAAWIDMGTVKKLAMWAVASDSTPTNAPPWVPQWAKDFAFAGEWSKIDQVVNWVISLKAKSEK